MASNDLNTTTGTNPLARNITIRSRSTVTQHSSQRRESNWENGNLKLTTTAKRKRCDRRANEHQQNEKATKQRQTNTNKTLTHRRTPRTTSNTEKKLKKILGTRHGKGTTTVILFITRRFFFVLIVLLYSAVFVLIAQSYFSISTSVYWGVH